MDRLNNYITFILHCNRFAFIVAFISIYFSFIYKSSSAQSTIDPELTKIAYTSLGNHQREVLKRDLYYNGLSKIDKVLVEKTAQIQSEKNNYLLSHANRKKTIIFTSALLVSSFSFDIYMRSASKKQRYNSLSWYLDRTNTVGEYQIVLKTIGSSLALGWAFQNRKLQQTALNSIRSVIVTKPISDLSKRAFGRARPRTEQGNLSFIPSESGKNPNYRSYISGHTSTAWALVTPYAEAYSRWLYILPLSTTIARLYLDRHWVSDVVAGGAVGFFAGYTAHHGSRYNIRLTGNGLIVKF